MEVNRRISQSKHSLRTTGGGQEEVAVTQADPRIQEIIGEVALTGVQSDALLDSDATPGASLSEALDKTDSYPPPGTSRAQALTGDAFTDTTYNFFSTSNSP